MNVPFATSAYTLDSLPVSAQECINAYPEREPEDAKTPIAVFGTPGITGLATCGLAGPVRGLHEFLGVAYAVSGESLYSISSAGVATLIGGGITGLGPVSMASNGEELIIVNGNGGFLYDGTTYSVITDPDFHAADSVVFFDNYFVLNWSGTPTMFLSGLLDGSTYDSLDTADAEAQPENILTIVNQQESLLVFSTGHIETWYDAGAANFPFQRIDGGTIERGLAAKHAVVKEDNSVFFLGDDLVFYRLEGVIPHRVSTHALETEWGRFASTSDAHCMARTIGGHKHIILTFPTGNRTWVFDIASGLWHRLESFDMSGNSLGRWVGNCVLRIYERDLVGSIANGQVGYSDPTTYSEFGNIYPMVLTSPHTHSDRRRVFYSNFEVDMETGVGIASGQGSDPLAMLRWSNDGGRSWSALQPFRTMGAIGATQTRVRWPGPLGQSRTRTWRLEVSDPVKRVVLAARCDVEVGI